MSDISPNPRFESIDNFRDFGGYAVRGGGRLRRGRLYRSAHHGRATDEDLGALAGLNLAVVVDLRRPDEREKEPSRRPPSFRGLIVENDLADGGDAYQAFVMASELTSESMRAFLLNYYRRAPFEPRHVDLYRRYFAALGAGQGPVLIHCAAGKDRTGILAALTHHALGVHWDDALADYLLTNDPKRIEERAPVYAEHLAAITGRRPDAAAVRTALGVETAYLEAAFEEIRSRCGSLDGYLETVLGMGAREVEAAAGALAER
jgi:protein tyrosine/serine phosphatase